MQLTFSMPKYRSPGVSLNHSSLAASPVVAPALPAPVVAGPELLPHFLRKLIAQMSQPLMTLLHLLAVRRKTGESRCRARRTPRGGDRRSDAEVYDGAVEWDGCTTNLLKVSCTVV